MSKLYRSLLWTGVVAAGVAACGDDVTVTPAPPPTPTVHSVSVGPSGTISVGQTLQMIASVNADAGVATTVTWSINAPATVATISGGGLLTAVGAGVVAVQACSTVNTSVCGNASVTITTAPTPTVTQVLVTPANPTLTRPATGAVSQQFSAAVIGTNSPAQTVTWSLPGSPANASISATGLLTITSAIAGGTINVSACSTVTGFTGVCGFAAVNILVPTPASISISDITWVPAAGAPANCTPTGAFPVAVLQTNVQCQIEVKVNVNAGDVVLQRLDILIGGQVVQSHTFPGTVASEGENASVSAPVDITLSVNTRQLRRPTGSTTLFVPVIPNGNQQLSANLYTSAGSVPLASTPFILVMNNGDMAMAVGNALTLVNNSSSPSFTNISGTWFTGTQTAGTVNYISFSTIVPSALSFTSTVCGASNTNAIAGTATTGITITGTFNCTNVQGANALTGVALPATYPTLAGPDGTPVTSAVGFSGVGTGFLVPTGPATTELRWNPISPIVVPPTLPAAVLVDNKAPTITPNEIGFMAGCSGTIPIPGCWINGSYNLAGDFPATDVGGTGVASVNTFTYDPSIIPNVCTSSSLTPASAAEDPSPTKYNACARATDNIGNVSGASFGFNPFGVDKTNPTITYAIDPLLVGQTLYAPSSTLAQQLLEAVPTTQQLDWKVNDNNAGLDTATALVVATAGTTLNGVCVISINGALNAEPAPGADRFMIPANAPFPDAGCGVPGYYHYQATVTDRAGNSASDVDRRFGFEPGVPAIAAIAPTLLYGGGQPATVTMFASHTGASLSAAKAGIWYTSNLPGPTATAVQLVYDQGNLFNAPFQTPLFLTTPLAGTPMTVPGSSVLAGIVLDSTQVPVSAFDSVTAIIRDVFDGAGFTGALVHADTANLVIPAPFIDAAKVSTSATVWANPQMGAATFVTVGSSCTFTYATPTNGPTIPTSVQVLRTIIANIYDVLFPITAAPTLISDNGTTRVYRYTVSTTSTCATLAGSGTLRLIAVKNDSAGLPVGYLVP